jgi:hypothetical protein
MTSSITACAIVPSIVMLSVIFLNVVMLSVIMLNVVKLSIIMLKCRYDKRHYAECRMLRVVC